MDRTQHGVEQLPGAAHEGLAPAIFLRPRRFSDDQKIGRPAADAEYRLGSTLVQGALYAGAYLLLQFAPVDCTLMFGSTGGARSAHRLPRDGSAGIDQPGFAVCRLRVRGTGQLDIIGCGFRVGGIALDPDGDAHRLKILLPHPRTGHRDPRSLPWA